MKENTMIIVQMTQRIEGTTLVICKEDRGDVLRNRLNKREHKQKKNENNKNDEEERTCLFRLGAVEKLA